MDEVPRCGLRHGECAECGLLSRLPRTEWGKMMATLMGFVGLGRCHEWMRFLDLEASTAEQLHRHLPLFNLPSKILCEVMNVQLRAEIDSDELYAQILLQPEADVKKVYAYIHRNGYKIKLVAAAVRNKQDVFTLLRIDYIIAPLKILQSLEEPVTDADVKYGYVQRLIPALDKMYNFAEEEYKGCNKFEKSELQNTDLLDKMFEDIRNTGEDHWSPAMETLPQSPVHASTPIDVEEHEGDNDDKDDSDQEDESSIASKGKRLCRPSNDKGKK